MKFISAGHCSDVNSKNYDPGATGIDKRTEAAETIKIKDRVTELIKQKGYTDIVNDLSNESLGQYLTRIKPGSGSVVVEFHFNAFNGKATGTEVVIGNDGDRLDMMLANELAQATAQITGLVKRSGGVIRESQTHRGRLGLMGETGIVSLVEVCFIDNPKDMAKFDVHFESLCKAYADIIIKYDNLIN